MLKKEEIDKRKREDQLELLREKKAAANVTPSYKSQK
jgi:hypothetical protein